MNSRFTRLNDIEKSLTLLRGSFLNFRVQQGSHTLALNTAQQERLQTLLIQMLEEEANQQAFELATLPALFARRII